MARTDGCFRTRRLEMRSSRGISSGWTEGKEYGWEEDVYEEEEVEEEKMKLKSEGGVQLVDCSRGCRCWRRGNWHQSAAIIRTL